MHFQLNVLFQQGQQGAFSKGDTNIALRRSWIVFSLIDSNEPHMSDARLKYPPLKHANLCNTNRISLSRLYRPYVKNFKGDSFASLSL